MKTLTLKSPAKINLFLHITGKRPDGYHNLQTVFRLIDFYDVMHFSIVENGNIVENGAKSGSETLGYTAPLSLKTAYPITQNPADNLVIKAGQALFDFAKQQNLLSNEKLAKLPFIEITLQKNIPMGAGLGGGSSNCATTLLALNQLWQLNLTNEQLRTIGAKLGADVPIFIFGQDAIAEGIGEVLTPIDLPPQRFLLLTPNAHINTAQLFAHPALQRDCSIFSHDKLLAKKADFLDDLTPEFCNVFEPVVIDLSAEVKNALDYLQGLTTETVARMSGSGSSVFLPLPDRLSQHTLENWQNNAPCTGYIVTSL